MAFSDRDECAFYGRFCQNGCANIPGGFTCLCDEGYFVSRNNRSCFGEFILII